MRLSFEYIRARPHRQRFSIVSLPDTPSAQHNAVKICRINAYRRSLGRRAQVRLCSTTEKTLPTPAHSRASPSAAGTPSPPPIANNSRITATAANSTNALTHVAHAPTVAACQPTMRATVAPSAIAAICTPRTDTQRRRPQCRHVPVRLAQQRQTHHTHQKPLRRRSDRQRPDQQVEQIVRRPDAETKRHKRIRIARHIRAQRTLPTRPRPPVDPRRAQGQPQAEGPRPPPQTRAPTQLPRSVYAAPRASHCSSP